jgi:DNA-binding XRE family transcriptional regulator
VERRSNLKLTSHGELVREAREAMGWTREQLAVLADVSLSLIVRFENEPGYTPYAPTLFRICRIVGVDVEDVLGAEALA